MRVLLSSDHEYPSSNGHGSGLHPKAFPSGSGYILHDLLAKGLAELGHEVSYLVRSLRANFSTSSVPNGIRVIFEPDFNADVLHTISGRDAALIAEVSDNLLTWRADSAAVSRISSVLLENGRMKTTWQPGPDFAAASHLFFRLKATKR